MRPDDLRFLLDYDAWAMERLLDAVDGLDGAIFAAETVPGHAAPRSTVLHCIGGMCGWRGWLESVETAPPAPHDAPTPADLRALWRKEHALLQEYSAGLSEGELGEVIERRRPNRVEQATRWQFVVHLVLHTMQHRSELAQELTLLGHSPGELGLTAFLQTKREPRP